MADQPEFPMPTGFVPPENLDADDQFQAMCTLEVVDNTTLKLIDVEGYQIGKGEEEQEEEREPGAGEAAPAPPAAGLPPGAGLAGAAAGPRGPTPTTAGMSADRLAAGAVGQRTPGYAERLAQEFRRTTGRR